MAEINTKATWRATGPNVREGDELIATVAQRGYADGLERTDGVMAGLARLLAAAPDMFEALKYPRHGDTAKLLEKAADLLDKQADPKGEGWKSYFTPHLRRAAEGIREALDKANTS